MSKVKKNKLIKELEETLIKKGVDIDEISDVLKKIENNLKDKKYGLVWENHTEEIEKELMIKFPVLKEEEGLRINKGEEHTNNFLIEGDNLESLTALKNMGKKVDVIYIDPPYNLAISGGGDGALVYNDRRIDAEDAYRHSKWLSFMEKRIRIARELLTEDGVIFMSIDDNEYANLKVMCDEIFGEENHLGTAIWEKKVRPSNKVKRGFSNNTEYVLTYGKDGGYSFKRDELSAKGLKGYRNPDNDNRGLWMTKPLWANSNTNKEKTLVLKDGRELTKKWFISQTTLNRMYDEDLIVESKNGGIRTKVFLKDGKGSIPKDLFYGEDVGTTERATLQLKEMFEGSVVFSYPKPIELLKYLIRVTDKKGKQTYLDFFSGSGSIGQAVLEYNKENGTNHNFILATNNENNICREVTYERINKVINGYTTPKGKEVEGIPANLTYLKTELKDKEDNLSEFELDENIIEHAVNNLKIIHNLSKETEIIENVLYELEDNKKNTKYIIYNNFFIDEDELKKVNKSENNIIYVSEENLQDSNLLEFDEVRNLNDLIVYK